MKARHPRTTSSIASFFILTSALLSLSATPAPAETELFFHTPEPASKIPDYDSGSARKKIRIKLDKGGDLLIHCGGARLVVAYNSPSDQLKPGEQQRIQLRDELAAINGVSFSASWSF